MVVRRLAATLCQLVPAPSHLAQGDLAQGNVAQGHWHKVTSVAILALRLWMSEFVTMCYVLQRFLTLEGSHLALCRVNLNFSCCSKSLFFAYIYLDVAAITRYFTA